MMDTKRALDVRKERKAQKPTFKAQNHGHKKRVSDSYKRPKGYQSKMRLGKKSRSKMPKPGFRSPKAVLGLNKDGLQEVVVARVQDLDMIDAKTQIAVIGSNVGMRKAIAIAKAAEQKGISVANADAKGLQTQFDEAKAARKKRREARSKTQSKKEEKKTDKKEEAPQKEAEKEAKQEPSDDAEKQKKKEQEKMLINKDKAM